MNAMSLKKKLIVLCSALIALIILMGLSGVIGQKKVSDSFLEVSEIHLPAVRTMGQADMMHDALRAVIYRALLAAESGSDKEKREVAEELKEVSENLSLYISEIEKLNIHPETRAALIAAKPTILAYQTAGEKIVGLALTGNRELAVQELPTFQTAFSKLEDDLGALGELIEKDSGESRDYALKIADRLFYILVGLSIFGLISGAAVSIMVVRGVERNLGRVVTELMRTSGEVDSTAKRNSGSAVQLSEATTEQASSLQETMASVEEISAMVQQNADSASRTIEVVKKNKVATEAGARNVDELLVSINEIKDTNEQILAQMTESNQEFNKIIRIISEIGTKTNVINEIVFQTKLLSFNASVEAARAGEHGKGFSVVAEEVGNLAQMSGNAAKEISDMLAISIKSVNEIVISTKDRVDRLIEVAKDKVALGYSVGQSCKKALDEVSVNAANVSTMVMEIAHASKEQAQGVLEINKAISQLDQVTQMNSNIATEGASVAEVLDHEATSLNLLVQELAVYAGIQLATTGGADGNVPGQVTEEKETNSASRAA